MNTIGKASAIALAFLALIGVSLAQTKPKYTPPPAKASAPAKKAPAPAPKAAPQRAAPQRQSRPATQPRSTRASQPRTSKAASSQRASNSQQRTEARQQREQQKQQKQQQKAQARQQREQQKQQEKQKKEQARQQKEQQKHPSKNENASASHPTSTPTAPPAAATSESHPTAPPVAATPESKPSQPHAAASAAYHVPEGGAVSGKTAGGATMLTKDGSDAVVGQLNSSRSHMSGINAKPLPSGDVTVHPNGQLTVAAAGERQYGVRSNGTISSYRDPQKSVSFDNGGRISSMRTPYLSERRSLSGERTIISVRGDNSRLVSTGPHSGYVEKNIVVGGRPYIQRTAIVNQRIITTRYVGYTYRGVVLHGYVAPVYYAPWFYGWAYNAFADPMYYGFGWTSDAWYAGSDPYFGAYPMYSSAAFWLTDYMLGETLGAAYHMREDASASADNEADFTAEGSAADGMNGSVPSETLQADATAPITPELKRAISEEVKQQIQDDKEAAASQAEQASHDELTAALSQPNHLFLASSNLDVISDEMQYCGLKPGDVLRLVSTPAADETVVQLRLAASQRSDCPVGVTVSVSLQDLQEMQNAFHSQIESGLETLLANQGHGGIPAAPAGATAAQPRPTVESAPVPASELTGMLDEQRQQADQAEAQVTASVE